MRIEGDYVILPSALVLLVSSAAGILAAVDRPATAATGQLIWLAAIALLSLAALVGVSCLAVWCRCAVEHIELGRTSLVHRVGALARGDEVTLARSSITSVSSQPVERHAHLTRDTLLAGRTGSVVIRLNTSGHRIGLGVDGSDAEMIATALRSRLHMVQEAVRFVMRGSCSVCARGVGDPYFFCATCGLAYCSLCVSADDPCLGCGSQLEASTPTEAY